MFWVNIGAGNGNRLEKSKRNKEKDAGREQQQQQQQQQQKHGRRWSSNNAVEFNSIHDHFGSFCCNLPFLIDSRAEIELSARS